ncbi:hypothetical protein [Streptomyces sp. NPDC096311]|uniref:hypothetical protein n=1 Tax=Streptomyces sp. NPDC096311 TaxID=3366083 RepID=UPI0038230E0F
MPRDGFQDVSGDDGLRERRGQLTHAERPPGPGRGTESRRRAGQTLQTCRDPLRDRTQDRLLQVVRLARPGGEHRQRTDRSVGARQGHRGGARQGHRGGARRPDAQAVAGRPDEGPALHGTCRCRFLVLAQLATCLHGVEGEPDAHRQP